MKTTFLPSEKSLEEMLNDCSIDAIIAIDADKNIIAWNTIAENIHGKLKAVVIGKSLLDIVSSIAEDEETLKAINLALKGVKSFVPASKKYFHRLHAENHFIPLKDDDNIIGVMNLVHDVAHRIKAEEQLQYLNDELLIKNKELQQRNAELISLSNVASHDLKEPLRKIYTAVEAIITNEARQLSNSGKAHLRRIQSAAQRMGLITDDLLSFTAIAENKNVCEPVNLNAVLADAKNKIEKNILEKNARITATELPVINGNHELLVQLFKNILHNAIKFQYHTPEIIITTRQTILNNKTFAEICFKDNGVGFNPQYENEVFNLFTKFHNDQGFHGSGMGLAICKKIMEQHNGFAKAKSIEGTGTEIYCYFPNN